MTRRTATVCLIAAAAFCSPSLAQHGHCEVRPWSVDLTPTPGTPYPIVFTNTPQALTFMNITIPLPEPVSSMPNCNYEISDLTMIRITLTLEDDRLLQFTSSSLSLNPPPPPPPPPPTPLNPGPYLFSQQASTIVLTFFPHLTGGMTPGLDLSFPAPAVNFSLAGGTRIGLGNVTVLGAAVQMSGNHYFIPEPGSLSLLGLGGVLAFRRRR